MPQLPARPHPALALIASLLLTAVVAGLGSLWTLPNIPVWYANLAKPSFTPPNSLFGPVWTLLYILMAVAVWLLWKLPDSTARTAALRLYLLQLLLNLFWPFLFFRQHLLAVSLLDTLLLLLAASLTAWLFFRLRPLAAGLLVPYLLWTAFATALNAAILPLNR